MPDATPHILVTLDGVEHPIHMDEITARQVMLLQQHFGISPTVFEVMLKAEAAAQGAGLPPGTVIDLPQKAALIYLSRLQVDGPKVKAEDLLDSVTLGSDTEVRLVRSFADEEVASLDPPA